MAVDNSESKFVSNEQDRLLSEKPAISVDSQKIRILFGPHPQEPDDSDEGPLADMKEIIIDEGPTPDY